MRLLLDTNIFVFLAQEQDSLSRDVQAILEDYDNQLCLSTESLRELIKYGNEFRMGGFSAENLTGVARGVTFAEESLIIKISNQKKS